MPCIWSHCYCKWFCPNVITHRQAGSKWESGTSDPSTSNLLALAKLFHISAEVLDEYTLLYIVLCGTMYLEVNKWIILTGLYN